MDMANAKDLEFWSVDHTPGRGLAEGDAELLGEARNIGGVLFLGEGAPPLDY